MDSTTRLTIDLPDDLADAVRARVSSGAYANESEVIAEALRQLDDESESVEEWLRKEIANRCRKLDSGEARLLNVDEVRQDLERRRGLSGG
jgi:antitoxin ParD1/3/4